MPVLRLAGTWCTETVARGSDPLRCWVGSFEPSAVVVDLSDVDFCDGRAISLLLELSLIAARRGSLLRLCRPSGSVIRLFTICDLDDLLEVDYPAASESRRRPAQLWRE